jgi:hypothetical protein
LHLESVHRMMKQSALTGKTLMQQHRERATVAG